MAEGGSDWRKDVGDEGGAINGNIIVLLFTFWATGGAGPGGADSGANVTIYTLNGDARCVKTVNLICSIRFPSVHTSHTSIFSISNHKYMNTCSSLSVIDLKSSHKHKN